MPLPTQRSIRTALVGAATLGAVLALVGVTSATASAEKTKPTVKSQADAKAKATGKTALLAKPALGGGGEGSDEGGSSGRHSTPIKPGTTTLGVASRSAKSGKLAKPALGGRGGGANEADD